MREITHLCPRGDSDVTECCHKSPFELPYTDRLTADVNLVDCEAPLFDFPDPPTPEVTT